MVVMRLWARELPVVKVKVRRMGHLRLGGAEARGCAEARIACRLGVRVQHRCAGARGLGGQRVAYLQEGQRERGCQARTIRREEHRGLRRRATTREDAEGNAPGLWVLVWSRRKPTW